MTVSLACAKPWRVHPTSHHPSVPVPACLVTYQAFQPNMDFFTEKLAEITVDKCTKNKGGSRRNRRKQKRKTKKKRKNPKKSKRLKKMKNRRKTRKLPNRKRKIRKMNRELRKFRRWKSLMSGKQEGNSSSESSHWTDSRSLPSHARHSLRSLSSE